MRDDLFKGFEDREQRLQEVIRYKIYTTMYYRTNLVIHSRRVSWILEELNPYALRAFGSNYDPVKALVMGLVHDDAEIEMGDIEAGIKKKMSAEELEKVYRLEEDAIEVLSQRYPKQVGKYSYEQLLRESFDHSSLESQVMQYADKFDAFGEALHEVYAGNVCFMTNVVNDYGVIDLPLDAYYKYFAGFFEKFPKLSPLLESGALWFQQFPDQDFRKIVKQGKPHSAESIYSPSGFWPYDYWVKANLVHASKTELAWLYRQREGLS